jgi:hypothetical protein
MDDYSGRQKHWTYAHFFYYLHLVHVVLLSLSTCRSLLFATNVSILLSIWFVMIYFLIGDYFYIPKNYRIFN